MTIFAKTVSVLTLGISLFSFVSINSFANNNGYKIVNTPKGVNLRDKNCNQKDFAGYGEKLYQYSENIINCKVNGKNYKMMNVGYGEGALYYVAQDFVSEMIKGDLYNTMFSTVNSPKGLTLRDKNCKKLTVVSNNTNLGGLNEDSADANPYSITCRVNNQYYELVKVSYNDKQYYAASVFLK